MKKTSIILVLSLMFSSCYSYVAFDPENNPEILSNQNENKEVGSKLKNVRNTSIEVLNEEDIPDINKRKSAANIKKTPVEVDLSSIKITDIIKTNQFYRINANGKQYKIEAKQWKADTLYAVEKGKPKHELKFHKDEISDVKIRKFSKGKSDALTVAAYALGGIGIFLLLK